MEFTTELLPIAQFPGTTEFNQMLVPVGFPAGEAQYEGQGVIVSGMDSGKATVCFYITGTQYGWGGKVGLWNGTKWVKLATTITPLEESSKSLACATITSSGMYAFIRYVVDASLLPVKGVCGYDIYNAWGTADEATEEGGWQKGYINYFEINSNTDLTGKTVTVTLLRSDPAGGYVWYGTATGVLIHDNINHYYFYVSPTVYYEWDLDQWNQPFWLLDFGNCTQEATTNSN
jgi:hypothetical protein